MIFLDMGFWNLIQVSKNILLSRCTKIFILSMVNFIFKTLLKKINKRLHSIVKIEEKKKPANGASTTFYLSWFWICKNKLNMKGKESLNNLKYIRYVSSTSFSPAQTSDQPGIHGPAASQNIYGLHFLTRLFLHCYGPTCCHRGVVRCLPHKVFQYSNARRTRKIFFFNFF